MLFPRFIQIKQVTQYKIKMYIQHIDLIYLSIAKFINYHHNIIYHPVTIPFFVMRTLKSILLAIFKYVIQYYQLQSPCRTLDPQTCVLGIINMLQRLNFVSTLGTMQLSPLVFKCIQSQIFLILQQLRLRPCQGGSVMVLSSVLGPACGLFVNESSS